MIRIEALWLSVAPLDMRAGMDTLLAQCHRPAHWSQLMIGTMEPPRDRHIEASP